MQFGGEGGGGGGGGGDSQTGKCYSPGVTITGSDNLLGNDLQENNFPLGIFSHFPRLKKM